MSTAATAALPLPGALARISPAGRFALGGLAIAIVALSVRLWPEWRHNPDLSHGLFMPFLFVLLLHEARSGPARYVSAGRRNAAGVAALLGGGLVALCLAGLYAASVDWSHALVNLTLTLSLAFFLGAGLLVFARESVRLIAFNWSAVAAVGLWLLATPIPPGTYTRLTLSLQLWVSEAVLRALHLLGVAAVRHGNIIDLANTAVGVEEACSGIRSLISCIFAAIFFSATLVRRVSARLLILALAVPLALGMNFLRSLTLTLLANRGIDIAGAWHDVTGFAVLGLTAALLGGLAVLLERRAPAPTVPPFAEAEPRARDAAAQWALAAGLACAALLVAVFVANTRPTPKTGAPAPNLLALLPDAMTGWQVTTTDLHAFRGTLQTEHLAQRKYFHDTPDGPTEIIIYVAYWRPGQAPVSLVASHTPDACWPGSGWDLVSTRDARAQLVVAGRPLAVAEHRLFEADHRPQQVWFWHLYNGRPLSYRDPYSAIELLRIAWRYGFRHDGDQLFVRVSSNRPWSQIGSEPLMAEFFSRTRALGL